MKNYTFPLDKRLFLSYNLFQAEKSATIEYIRGAAIFAGCRTRRVQMAAEMGVFPNPSNLFG